MVLFLLLLLVPNSRSAEAAATPTTSGVADSSIVVPSDDMLKLRDPFKRPEIESASATPKGELENYSVDSFKMVGVLTGPSKMRAMLSVVDGKTFLVRTGMKIGTRNGVILKIAADKVQVREKIMNVLGQEENVDTDIPMASDSKNANSMRGATVGSNSGLPPGVTLPPGITPAMLQGAAAPKGSK